MSTPPEPDAYMEAFMNGFDFVLLAMRGRLAEANLPAKERERIEGFLRDYSKIADAYRTRRAAAPTTGIELKGKIPRVIEAHATN